MKPEQLHLTVRIAGPISNLAVPVKALSDQRGTYLIRRVFFDWVSPLRFWVFREKRALDCEVRVYPDLALEGRKIAHFLDRGGVWVPCQTQNGRRRELPKLREYEARGSLDFLDLEGAAKRHKPNTQHL